MVPLGRWHNQEHFPFQSDLSMADDALPQSLASAGPLIAPIFFPSGWPTADAPIADGIVDPPGGSGSSLLFYMQTALTQP